MARFRPGKWTVVTILLGIGAYVLLRLIRPELVDFEVYRTAAARALAAQPLYRLDDGHYQYKYFPAFALFMAPFAWPPKPLAEAVWFALTVAMAAGFVGLSLRSLPDRRMAHDRLIWLGLLLVGRFLVKELAFGQTNLLFGLVLLSAGLAVQRGRHIAAGVLVGMGMFVKPYALVFVPWLMWASGAGAFAACAGVVAVGLILPAAVYGWAGNLDLLVGWYRIVTGATAHTLLAHENISFASMWAKWLRPEEAPGGLVAATSAIGFAMAGATVVMRRRVASPACLEYAAFALLVPLVSPQGWDYVLLLGLPGYLLLADRWRDTPWPWRAVMLFGVCVTSFTLFDVMRRPVYMFVVTNGLPTLGALALLACLVRLRWRALA
jgi:hypothetical protein